MKHKQMVEALKTVLKSKGITYLNLSKMLKISEQSVKRLFSKGTFTLERFMEVCDLLGLSLDDLTKMAEISSEEIIFEFSFEQEEFFAKNIKFLAFFNMLFKNTPDQIAKKYNLNKKDLLNYLSKLDELGLIEWLPGNKVKLLTPPRFKWREDGPLGKRFWKFAFDDFHKPKFDHPLAISSLLSFEFSKSSQKKLREDIEKLLREAKKVSDMERILKVSTKKVGLYVAMRSWEDYFLDTL